MGLGAVLGDEAQHRSRVREIPIAPAIVRGGEEDAIAEVGGGGDGPLEDLDHVTLAQPHGEVACAAGPVLSVHAADADAQDRQTMLVGVLAPERLAIRLAHAVERGGAEGRLVGQHGPAPQARVAPGDQRGIRLLALVAGDGGPAGGKDHPLDPGAAGRLEDIVGADQVVAEHGLPGLAASGRGGQMHHHVDVLEGRLDGAEVGDVPAMARHAGKVAPVERAQRVLALEPLAQRAPDQTAHPGDEDARRDHGRAQTVTRTLSTQSRRKVRPSPGPVGARTWPSSKAISSSTSSLSRGLWPRENSMMVAQGVETQRWSPVAKRMAEPQRCGATVTLWLAASAAMRCTSVRPPAMAGSGWSTSTARASSISRNANRVCSLSPAAMGMSVERRTSACPERLSGDTGSSSQARS